MTWPLIAVAALIGGGILLYFYGKAQERNVTDEANIKATEKEIHDATKIDTDIKLDTDKQYIDRLSKWTRK